ncbi:hypothetical protein H5410_034726 [Solanum commersonii]|uniref:adenylate dimethylallyltransferase (ADP/ATP-dependent) n=1 Tax=Solanum commersonii TaxID=4109 RepID=A0A9J5YWA9_SOLCO|nr:hypothetical protein H5410_034726 [Solanum commersonii]
MCNQTCPLIHIGQPPQMDHKVVVVMGATGAGKSRLSIDLIQVYKRLDIATNKITENERCSIPHHLIDPYKEFTAKSFCNMASFAINSIIKWPYDFCFLWVDVSMHILNSLLSERVDKMVDKGIVNEVRTMFNPTNSDYSKGIRKVIGVPEFDRYVRAELSKSVDEETHSVEEATNEVKINNCKLASQQLEKINRLINVKGRNVHRLDATQVMLKKRGKREEEEIWKNMVMEQSKKTVTKSLCQNYNNKSSMGYCSTDGRENCCLWHQHPISFDLTKRKIE